MFTIICLTDHTPDGAPAGSVVAEYQYGENAEDSFDELQTTYPRCNMVIRNEED